MTVGCLLAQGFDDVALRIPRERLQAAGVHVILVGSRSGAELLDRHRHERVRVEVGMKNAHPDDFAGVYIPGGRSPDRLRADARVVAFVREIFRAGKPIGAIAHGPQLLLTAGLVRGRRLTASPTVRGDLRAAGAFVLDRAVVVDGNLVTSRTSDEDDIDAFSVALLTALGLGPEAQAEDVISVQPSS